MGRTWLLPMPIGLAIGHSSMDGFWFVPRAQLDASVAPRLAALRTAKAAVAKPAQERQKQLLPAYDQNRNGVLDPDEKRIMISDPKYLRQNWPAIDANKNQLIDLVELSFFDADANGVASDNEMDAIDKMLEIEADDLLGTFDKNKDEGLNDDEMRTLAGWIKANSTERSGTFADFGVPSQSDINENGRLERTELKELLSCRLFGRLFSGAHMTGSPALARIRAKYPLSPFSLKTATGKADCKAALEALWSYRPSSGTFEKIRSRSFSSPP